MGELDMAVRSIGELIKSIRKQCGVTQKDLCYGIISVAALSRIENGERSSSKDIIEALLQRLGFQPDEQILDFFCDKEDYDILQKKAELDSLMRRGDIGEVEKMIEKLEKDANFLKSNLNKQLLACAKAHIAIKKKLGFEESYGLLIKAANITILEFNEDKIDWYLFSNQEIRIVNMISITYCNNGNIDKAIDILYRLKANVEREHIELSYRGKNLPLVAYNLTKILGEVGRDKETIYLCEEAMKVCIETNNMWMLPSLVLNKGTSLFELGEIEESKELLIQAFYGYKMYRLNKKSIEIIKNYIKEKFNVIL